MIENQIIRFLLALALLGVTAMSTATLSTFFTNENHTDQEKTKHNGTLAVWIVGLWAMQFVLILALGLS